MSSILFLLLFPGQDYLNQHNFTKASRYYRLVASISPSYDVYYNAAICNIANHQLDTGVRQLQIIPFKKPDVFYYLGVAYYQLGFYEKALSYFDLFAKNGKKQWWCNYYMGLLNLKHHKIEAALEKLNTTPDSKNKVFLMGYIENYKKLIEARIYLKEENYQDAIEFYAMIDNFFGFKEIGRAYALSKLGEYEQSLALLDTVINHSDDKQLIVHSLIKAGRVSFTAKNFSMAHSYVKRYLEINPDDEAYFLRGEIFSGEVQHDSAAYYFKTLPDTIDEYLFYKGRTDYFLGLWGRAEEQLLRHREYFPHSTFGDRATYILASINSKRNEYVQAIDFWEELIKVYPASIYAAAAQKGIGDAYFNMEHYRKALNAYSTVEEYEPTPTIDMQTKLKIYETLYYLGKYPSLIDALRSYIEENKSAKLVPVIHLRIAKILFEKHAFYQSLSELEKLIDGYYELPITSEAFIERARIYERLGKNNETKRSFQQLFMKKNAEAYYSYAANELANIYLKESRYDSTLYYYNLLLNYDTYRERSMFEIARIYHKLGQDKGAETIINQLIDEYPSSVFLLDAYVMKSEIYKNQGNYQEAISILSELIKKVGHKPEIYIEIGNIYSELEQYPAARDHYLNAAEYFKQKRDDAAKSLILAGDASVKIGDKKSAHEYYLQASLIAEVLTLKNRAAHKMSTVIKE